MLKGKTGLIVGVANTKSIAFGIAKRAKESGAELILTYFSDQLKGKVQKVANELGVKYLYKLDATNKEDIKNITESIKRDIKKIDFFVHSIAFAPRRCLEGGIIDTTQDDFLLTMNTSVFTFLSLTKALMPLFNENSSILTLTFMGGDRYVPYYNVMGIAKAALESCVRYLAVDCGKRGIRVNAISAGPIKTLAASAISDFRMILKWNQTNAPLKRNVTLEDVGKSALYILSDLSSGVTGEVHYVDSGYNVMGMAAVKRENGTTKLEWNQT